MGVFLPDKKLFSDPVQPVKGYIETVAQAQADEVLKDFVSGKDKFKTLNRMKHRLDKIRRRCNLRDYNRIVERMNAIIQASPQFNRRAPSTAQEKTIILMDKIRKEGE